MWRKCYNGPPDRCISTTHEAHASTRLTPPVMTLGQAAGTAAAFCAERKGRPRDIDVRELRAALVRDGVDLRRTASVPS